MTDIDPTTALAGAQSWEVIHADSLERLPRLAGDSVDAVVTDPPYGIGFDNQDWDLSAIHRATSATTPTRLSDGQAFQAWTTIWARELARILKPGGHLVAFAAPRMAHRLTSGLEDAGFEIRDVLMWLYGQGMPKSRRLPAGQGTALKPAYEPIVLARTPTTAPIHKHLRRHPTGALNTDACRIESTTSPGGRERRVTAEGRWPANVLLSHHPDCRARRCARGCAVRTLDAATRRRDACGAGAGVGASRFFYCAKASRRERDAGCQHLPARHLDLFPNAHKGPGRSARVVRNAHPTVKPVEVMRWLVRLATPLDGVVLDPFCGSGSTGIAALLEDRRFIGIELDRDHAQTARARITHAADTHES